MSNKWSNGSNIKYIPELKANAVLLLQKIQCGSFSPYLSLFSHTAHFSPSCQDFSTTFFIFYRKQFQQALSDSRVLYFPTTDCIFFHSPFYVFQKIIPFSFTIYVILEERRRLEAHKL